MSLIKDREYKKEKAYHTPHGFTISMGNDKMGFVPSFSVTPGVTCDVRAPCWRKGICYAVSMEKRYPSVRTSWANNLSALKACEYDESDVFVQDLVEFVNKKKPEIFRWHVGGDIYSTWYLDQMCQIAKKCPDVKFWAFTKQFGVLSSYENVIPDNLNIILSVWPPTVPSVELMKRFGCNYFQDKSGTYIVPDDAFVCQGDCEMCRRCVTLGPGESTVIVKH